MAGALSFWIVFAFVAFILWFVSKDYDIQSERFSNANVLKQPMVRYVALFFGLQAFLFFAFVTWYPTILIERGFSLEQTGLFGLIFQFVGIPINLILPLIAERAKNQMLHGMISGAIFCTGLILFYFSHNFVTAVISFIVLGIGSCATLALSFAFIALRSSNSLVATQVSTVTQVVGSGFAALGPVSINLIYYFTKNWNVSIIFLILVSVIFTIFATLAGGSVEIQ